MDGIHQRQRSTASDRRALVLHGWTWIFGLMLIALFVVIPVPTMAAGTPRVITWPDKTALSGGQTEVFAAPSDVVAMAGGAEHSLALKSDGTVVAWGCQSYPGSSSNGECDVPARLSTGGVTAIAAGTGFSLAVQNGGVVAWGRPAGVSVVPNSLSSGVTNVAAGSNHALAIQYGSVVAWGCDGDDYGQCVVPPQLRAAADRGGVGVVAIAAGASHSLALDSTGAVWAWGKNDNGQLRVPSEIQPQGRTRAVAIAAGGDHNLALTSDGRVLAWGELTRGNRLDVPAPLDQSNSGATAIAAGAYHSMVLSSDGTVTVWGSSVDDPGATPPPGGLQGVHSIAAGKWHNLASVAATSVAAGASDSPGGSGGGAAGARGSSAPSGGVAADTSASTASIPTLLPSEVASPSSATPPVPSAPVAPHPRATPEADSLVLVGAGLLTAAWYLRPRSPRGGSH
jgi:alpha-tubulin suppressor-like RCC1 family protein